MAAVYDTLLTGTAAVTAGLPHYFSQPKGALSLREHLTAMTLLSIENMNPLPNVAAPGKNRPETVLASTIKWYTLRDPPELAPHKLQE